jgi:hypothetical protein
MQLDVFIDRILDSLERRLGKKRWKSLREAIEADHALISGSFVLECIMEVDLHVDDIDIFVPAGATQLIEWLQWNKPTAERYEDAPLSYSDDVLGTGAQISVYTGVYDNDKVQVIASNVPRESLYEYMCDNFDLNVCKNALDFVSGRPRLRIFDFNAIEERRCAIRHKNNVHRTMWRIRKYRDRGFEILLPTKTLVRAIVTRQETCISLQASCEPFYLFTKINPSTFEKIHSFAVGVRSTRYECGGEVGIYTRGVLTKEQERALRSTLYLTRGEFECAYCEPGYADLEHWHFHHQKGQSPISGVILYMGDRDRAWKAIVDAVLALFPLSVPTYLLLWILEHVPEVAKAIKAQWVNQAEAVQLIAAINDTFRKQRLLAREGQNKVSRSE